MAQNSRTCTTCQGDQRLTRSAYKQLTGEWPADDVAYPDCPACIGYVIEAPGVLASLQASRPARRHPASRGTRAATASPN